jgi:phage portal protein BeeE
MTDTEQKQLQDKYDDDYTGAPNFGKVKVSTSKLGYVQMGMNPNDLKSIETRLEHLRTICASYNVDSKLFGDPAASTYNNMAEAQRAFIVNAVIPLSQILLPAMVKFMSRSVFAAYSMQLDEDNILELQLTNEQRSARLGREVVQGIITTEQARAMLYPELVEELEEGGEEVIASTEERTTLTIDEVLRLQENIENGRITRDNAVALLAALYGLSEQTANEIIG